MEEAIFGFFLLGSGDEEGDEEAVGLEAEELVVCFHRSRLFFLSVWEDCGGLSLGVREDSLRESLRSGVCGLYLSIGVTGATVVAAAAGGGEVIETVGDLECSAW